MEQLWTALTHYFESLLPRDECSPCTVPFIPTVIKIYESLLRKSSNLKGPISACEFPSHFIYPGKQHPGAYQQSLGAASQRSSQRCLGVTACRHCYCQHYRLLDLFTINTRFEVNHHPHGFFFCSRWDLRECSLANRVFPGRAITPPMDSF